MESFKYLFTPIKIKNLEFKNRFCMPAIDLNYTKDGTINDRIIEFYKERAKNEVSLITIGGCFIDDIGGGPGLIGISDDKFIPGLSKLTEELHKYGTYVSAQLYHAGKYVHSSMIGGKKPVSASAIRSKLTGEVPQELDKEGIKRVQESFANAAYRAKKAGFDAVEIISSAGYLICQFLSPVTNKRTDEYGGTLENRMRFGIEVIQKVREAVGKDFLVIIRISGNDFVKGSNTNKEWQIISKEFRKAGVDVFNVTGGWHETKVPQLPFDVPYGNYVYLAEGIKLSVDAPVIASNRLNDPYLANEVIRLNKADLINLARPLIADPEYIVKLKQNDIKSIAPCIGCNQGCFDEIFSERPLSCLVNPRAGFEYKVKITEDPNNQNKTIVIVGGGVTGCTLAKTLSARGYKVKLYEKERLGGQFNLAASYPGKKDFKKLVEYYEHTITNDKNIELIKKAPTYEDIKTHNPHRIFIATGGSPIKPPIKGIDKPHVYSAWDILKGKGQIGRDIVIIGGGSVGCEVALYIAEKSTISAETTHFLLKYDAEDIETIKELIQNTKRNITILEMLPKIGRDIGISTRWVVLQNLKFYKIKMQTSAKVLQIEDEKVIYEKNGKKESIKADTVIYATGTKAENILYEELKEKFDKICPIGDAKQPKKGYDNIHEAFDIALSV